jgi:hypothetical protein
MRFKSSGVLLALVAVFAISAVAASAASAALPEFKPVPSKKKFTSTGGVSTWAGGGETINCSKSSTSGEITSATTLGDVIVKYTGCTIKTPNGFECPIKSRAGGKEEILMEPLKGELGTIVPKPASGSDVGLLLQTVSGKGWAVLESECATDATLSGSLAGSVEVGGYGKTNTLRYTAPGGVQEIKEMKMDSGTVVKPKLTAFSATWAISATDPLKFEESLEVT